MPRQRKKDDAAVRDERLNDPSLVKAARLLGQLADKQCGPTATFEERSRAARRVAAALLSSFQEDTDADEREDSEG